jgi:hypothetical protein
MPTELHPVDLDFLEQAPVVQVCREVLHRPAAAIFAAVSEDPAGWGSWFPGFSHQGRYLSPPPHGVGAVREVVMLGVRFRERILAWDAPSRWAFCVDQASVPFATAFAEEYRLTPEGDRSVVQWTLAMDPRGPVRRATPLMGAVLPRLFRRAMGNLERRLAA